MLAVVLAGPGAAAAAGRGTAGASSLPDGRQALPRPDSWRVLRERSRATGRPIIVLFSTAGCAWCELVRRDHLRYLARDQLALGVLVAELDLLDRRPFGAQEPDTPAGLARALGVRVAPSVLFMGPDGELAERLIGYQSADFYGAYVTQRIREARQRLAAPDGSSASPGA